MKRIRPDYYNLFTCTANQCPITCCQEWKISVDPDTYHQWKTLVPPKTISMPKSNLANYTIQKEDFTIISLNEQKKCPFLDEKKLCQLVTAYGDCALSQTCKIFPRDVHIFDTHEEETMMPCCPAVIDLWNQKEILSFPEKFENDSVLFQIRSAILHLIQNTKIPLEECLLEIFYILLELYRNEPVTTEMIEDYFSSATVRQLKSAIEEIDLPILHTMEECNELIQDLSVNYKKEGLYLSYLNPILSLAEQISEGYEQKDLQYQWESFYYEFSSFQSLLRNYLSNEIFSNLLMPDADLKDMIIQMQWIALEYTAIRQSLFLKWISDGSTSLKYETVRDYIVIISRMTGYEEDDIYEYLENSFQELIWDWGYFALILSHGNDIK